MIEITPREASIMFYRSMGFTLEECGKKFGVTRERIRQIEAKAHAKLKKLERIANEKANTR